MSEHANELRLSRGEILRRLWRFLEPLYGMAAFSITMRVLNLLSATALISLAAGSIARYVGDHSVARAQIGWLVLAAGGMGLFHYLEQWSGHYIAFRLLAVLRNHFYDKLEPLSPAGTAKLQSGDAVARVINDVERIEPFYAHTVAPAAAALIVPPIFVAVLWRIHPRFGWTLAIVMAVLVLVLPWLVDRLASRASTQARVVFGRVNAHLTDSFQGLRDTLALGYGERRRTEMWKLGEELDAAQAVQAKADALQRAILELAVAASVAVMLWTGIELAMSGAIDVLRDLPIVIGVTATSFTAVIGLANVMNDLNLAIASADRVYELLDQEPNVREHATRSAQSGAASIVFDDVTFGYGPRLATRDGARVEGSLGKLVLDGVSLSIPAGTHVALVGASGAGKSTIVNLLMRFWDPLGGRIALGEKALDAYTLDDLRAHIAVVSQRTYIFNTSIRENIVLAKPDASEAELMQAVERANLSELVRSLPEGLDAPCGEMGSRLSGGQRQRIAIARALLKDAPVLVLDEATSNLDVENERDINAAVARLSEGRTVITIAHRLSTVISADRIVVLDRGRIAEQGTHQELLAQGGVYARLFELQRDEIDGAPANDRAAV